MVGDWSLVFLGGVEKRVGEREQMTPGIQASWFIIWGILCVVEGLGLKE